MAKAKFDIPTQIPAGATRPLYAGVGATDLFVKALRERVAGARKTVSGFDYQPQALREQASKVVTASVETLNKDAQTRRRAVEQAVAGLQAEAKSLPTRLQHLVDGQVSTAGDTYADLVKQGETLVARIRRQQSSQATASSAKTTKAKAKTTKTQASKTASSSATTAKKTAKKTATNAKKSPARSSAKATTTAAAKTASNATQAATDAAAKVGD